MKEIKNMYKEIGVKCNGKTHRLLEYAYKNRAIVVCGLPRAMEEKAREYGIGNVECISYPTFLDVRHKLKGQTIVIDEIEGLLERLSTDIIGYTLGVEENEV